MKKIFFSAALAAMMMASCQNENLVNSNEMQEEFTVEVTKGMDSRVYMDGSVAKWSADDALYVYGTNGVRGTLYLTSGADSKTATFTGVISGSSKNLTNAIFGNVKHNGDEISLTLSNVDASQCDAPMFGAFSADKGSISLDYICGLVPVKITEDGNGKISNVKLGGVGVSTLTLVNGEWVPGTDYANITLTNVPDGKTFYVPFFTTEEETEIPLTIKVDTKTYTYLAETKAGGISTTTAPELRFDENEGLKSAEGSTTTQPSILNVTTAAELNKALSGQDVNEVVLAADIVTDQAFEVLKDFTIYGNNHSITSTARFVFNILENEIGVEFKNLAMVNAYDSSLNDDTYASGIRVAEKNVGLALDNCSVRYIENKGKDWSYAVNLTGVTEGCGVTIIGGYYEGANVINIWGKSHEIMIDGATLTSLYYLKDSYCGVCLRLNANNNFMSGGNVVTVKNSIFNGKDAKPFEDASIIDSQLPKNILTEMNNTDNTMFY